MQAIRTRYIGPTNTRGPRIQAKCDAKTIYMSYDHALTIDENHMPHVASWPSLWGGVTCPIGMGHVPKRDLYNRMTAFIAGLEASK